MLTYKEDHHPLNWTVVNCIRDGYEILYYTDIYTDDANEYQEKLAEFKLRCEALFAVHYAE